MNQQDSEPTPVGLQIFGKKKSLNKSNLVAPFNPEVHNSKSNHANASGKRIGNGKGKSGGVGSRYKCDILDD